MKKKRLLAINALSFGSTGKIMQGICREATLSGYETQMYVRTDAKPMYQESEIFNVNSSFFNKLSMALNKLTGLEGHFAFLATKRLIKRIKRFAPDIIHLHIMHSGYLHLPSLFRYLKKSKIPVVWTFHDCWAMTGHCPHFAFEKCEKWKTGCYQCPRYKEYPKSLYDNSRFMWRKKKRWFSSLPDLTIATPSQWLADFVKDSYLKEHSVRVIHNGIDLNVFSPSDSASVKEKYNLQNKKILLGIASSWSDKKGLDIFIALAGRLSSEYQIVLVGTNDVIDAQLPETIISIHRTENQKQLAELYSAADLFVNPTREDTFPTVNIESLACGTPVLTFQTGGSPEIIDDTCGAVVACDDIDALQKEIIRICTEKPYTKDACLQRAQAFDMRTRFADYVSLCDEILERKSYFQ